MFKYLHYIIIAYVFVFMEWHFGFNMLIQAVICVALKRILQKVWPEIAARPDGDGKGMPSGHVLVCTSFFAMNPTPYALAILFCCTVQRMVSRRHNMGQVMVGSVLGLWLTPAIEDVLRTASS